MVASVSRAQESPFSRVAEVRALSPEAAVAQRPAVRVRAGVTFVISHPEDGRPEVTNFTIQEEAAGIWVNLEWARRDQIWAGDETVIAALREGAEVEIEGVLAQGGLAPNILPRSVRVLGAKPLPQARVVALDRLMSGAEIAQRETALRETLSRSRITAGRRFRWKSRALRAGCRERWRCIFCAS